MSSFYRLYHWLCLIVATIWLTSCSKQEVVVGNGREAYINFYNASEVLKQGIADLPVPVGGTTTFYFSAENMIYINDSATSPLQYGARNNFTRLQFARGFDDRKQFPISYTGAPNVVDDVARTYGNVFWMPIAEGHYRFIYTSAFKNYLVDSFVELQPKTYTTQYLTEDPATDSSYRIVTVPAYLYAQAGKVRVQAVHLSPDRDAVDIYRMDKDGNRQGNAIVAGLQFGQHNDYIDIDTTGASASYGNIVLGVYRAGSTTKLFSIGVPAQSGASFVAVIQGFVNATRRRIIINAHGYTTAPWSVSPDFRINIRRVS